MVEEIEALAADPLRAAEKDEKILEVEKFWTELADDSDDGRIPWTLRFNDLLHD